MENVDFEWQNSKLGGFREYLKKIEQIPETIRKDGITVKRSLIIFFLNLFCLFLK